MKKLFIVTFVLLIVALSGCSGLAGIQPQEPVERPQTLYQAQVIDPASGTRLSIDALARKLSGVQVVVVGEYHGHPAAHLLQSQIQAALYRQNPLQVLTMEQFNLDTQNAVNAYLRNKTGEAELIEDADAWDNYRASYRPLVEFARLHNLPVIAANAPAHIVRCVGRTGPDYLSSLPAKALAELPGDPFMDTPGYRKKFDAALAGGHSTTDARMDNTYKAQLLRDNTMASRILQALDAYPGHQIVHTTGTFHSQAHLGTVALLHKRAPEVSVAVISPVVWPPDADKPPLAENRNKGDFLFFVQPLPEEYLSEERRKKAMSARFRQSAKDTCQEESR